MKTPVRPLALALLALVTPRIASAEAPHCAEGRRNIINGVATSDDVHYGSDLTWRGATDENHQQLKITGCNNTVSGNDAGSSDVVLVGSDNVRSLAFAVTSPLLPTRLTPRAWRR